MFKEAITENFAIILKMVNLDIQQIVYKSNKQEKQMFTSRESHQIPGRMITDRATVMSQEKDKKLKTIHKA